MAKTETLEGMHQWEQIGAIEKVKSILELASGHPHDTVLEIGCSTGAVLEGLAAAGFATRYCAVEPSAATARFVQDRGTIPSLELEATTLEQSRFAQEQFDVAILSHVIEHVPNPAELIIEAQKLSRLLIIEVPADNTLGGKARYAIRRRIKSTARENNRAGHINFFAPSDLDNLVTWCGSSVVRRRVYVPRPQLEQAASNGSPLGRLRSRVSLTGSAIIGDMMWTTLYHGHYAVAAVPRPPVAEADKTAWPTLYYEAAE